MSSRNPRKIIRKDIINNNNYSNNFFINKKITKNNISSIELRTERHSNLFINTAEKSPISINKKLINKSNITLKNNKQLSIPNISSLNKTPEKDEKIYIRYIKDNYSAQQNKKINIPEISKHIDNSSKKINLSNIYKLPIILKNDYKTLKLNTIKKETINKSQKTDSNREESIKQCIKQMPSINISRREKISEMKNRMNNDLNKDVNINIIDYNKICVKKELKPIKIIMNKNLSSQPKKNENNQLTKLQNYMKDRFYMDTEAKMSKKLKDTVFNHDHSLKDKIIEMNKIGEFWGGIVDYCNPVFSIKRFGYLKKKLDKNKKNRNNNSEGTNSSENILGSKKSNKNEIKSMRLFTINSYLDYKHQKKMETRKEFLEKYNNSLKYYML